MTGFARKVSKSPWAIVGLTFSLGAAALLPACGPRQEPGSADAAYLPELDYLDTPLQHWALSSVDWTTQVLRWGARKYFGIDQIQCVDPAHCPAQLATLIIEARLDDPTLDDAGCTAILISADVVLTNAHCAPKGVAALHLYFPATAVYPPVHRSVTEVLASTWTPDLNKYEFKGFSHPMDFSYLKLNKPVARPPMRRSQRLLAKDEPVSAWVVENIGDRTRRVSMKRLTADFVRVTDRLLILDGDQPLIRGNSGGALLNQEGLLSGLIFGGANSSAAGYAWSISCIPAYPNLSAEVPPGCRVNYR